MTCKTALVSMGEMLTLFQAKPVGPHQHRLVVTRYDSCMLINSCTTSALSCLTVVAKPMYGYFLHHSFCLFLKCKKCYIYAFLLFFIISIII